MLATGRQLRLSSDIDTRRRLQVLQSGAKTRSGQRTEQSFQEAGKANSSLPPRVDLESKGEKKTDGYFGHGRILMEQ